MDPNSWTRLSTSNSSSSRRYQSRSDAFHLVEETDGDEPRPEYLCPFCAEDFDIVGLCCHIDEEHTVQAKNGVCPICAKRVGTGLVSHITMQHGSLLKISFYRSHSLIKLWMLCFFAIFSWIATFNLWDCCFSLTRYHVQRKRRFRRVGANSTLSILKKELREGNLQSLLGGSSFLVPSSMNTEADPLLSSFMNNTAVEPLQDQSYSSAVEVSVVEGSNKDFLARSEKQQSGRLSGEDEEEKGRRSAFVQGLLMSTFLDDDL
ncbi:hypothetical protein OSB04_009633 [Centaurea solstitialis]|uniref:Uncharacterized protein n=1 Tax=Centaurea solstitialis TaxID=347529 RepID=A0AA38WMB4_9ASTR|nr:hypothetical protein OSB04_009633 [Centaurea solstitialis]